MDNGHRVTGRPEQRNSYGSGVLRPLAIRAGVNEHQHMGRVAGLPAQLLRCHAGKRADGLFQRLEVTDRLPKRPGAGDLLLGGWLIVQSNAGHPSTAALTSTRSAGPVMGYALLDVDTIEDGVRRLSKVLLHLRRKAGSHHH